MAYVGKRSDEPATGYWNLPLVRRMPREYLRPHTFVVPKAEARLRGGRAGHAEQVDFFWPLNGAIYEIRAVRLVGRSCEDAREMVRARPSSTQLE